jgi:hypothetical protein
MPAAMKIRICFMFLFVARDVVWDAAGRLFVTKWADDLNKQQRLAQQSGEVDPKPWTTERRK